MLSPMPKPTARFLTILGILLLLSTSLAVIQADDGTGLLFEMTEPEVDAVAEKLASYANVRFVIISAGRYDIITWVMFREPEDLSNFIRNELGTIPGLVSAETMIYLDIKRFSFTFASEDQTNE